MALNWIRKNPIVEFEPESPAAYVYPHLGNMPLEVGVRFIGDWQYKQRPVLCIEIRDSTTMRNIRASWKELKRLRSELNLTRGPYDRSGGGSHIFYQWCWKCHEDGYSWDQIAETVNEQIKKALTPPDNPLTVPSTPAYALIDWACGDSRGSEPIPDDLEPEDILPAYPATGEGLKARVRTWRARYGMS